MLVYIPASFSSHWGCSNGSLNVVFVMLPGGVNERILSLQW